MTASVAGLSFLAANLGSLDLRSWIVCVAVTVVVSLVTVFA